MELSASGRASGDRQRVKEAVRRTVFGPRGRIALRHDDLGNGLCPLDDRARVGRFQRD